jgi:hypothetical protein
MEPTRLMNSGCVQTKIRNGHDQIDTTFRDLASNTEYTGRHGQPSTFLLGIVSVMRAVAADRHHASR